MFKTCLNLVALESCVAFRTLKINICVVINAFLLMVFAGGCGVCADHPLIDSRRLLV